MKVNAKLFISVCRLISECSEVPAASACNCVRRKFSFRRKIAREPLRATRRHENATPDQKYKRRINNQRVSKWNGAESRNQREVEANGFRRAACPCDMLMTSKSRSTSFQDAITQNECKSKSDRFLLVRLPDGFGVEVRQSKSRRNGHEKGRQSATHARKMLGFLISFICVNCI